MSELPPVVDIAWLERELGADDLFLGDVREVDDAGHLVNVERPDRFNALLREFVADV